MVEPPLGSRGARNPDADLHLDVDGLVTLADLTRLVGAWTDFLGEVGKSVVGNPARDAVRYVVTTASGGSFGLGVRPTTGERGRIGSHDVPDSQHRGVRDTRAERGR